MKFYSEARKIAFTKESILAAWRGTGLAPYNPTAVSEAAPYVHRRKPETKSPPFHRVSPIGLGAGVAIPEDARNGTRDRAVVCRHPKLPYGAFRWVARAVNCRLKELRKVAIQGRMDADIHREANKTFEAFAGKKQGGKR